MSPNAREKTRKETPGTIRKETGNNAKKPYPKQSPAPVTGNGSTRYKPDITNVPLPAIKNLRDKSRKETPGPIRKEAGNKAQKPHLKPSPAPVTNNGSTRYKPDIVNVPLAFFEYF
jgi:hypothetical protein